MLSKESTVGLCAVAGVAMLGYCVYFDKKRRSEPGYKKRVEETSK